MDINFEEKQENRTASKKALDNVKEYEKFEIEKWCVENRNGFS